VATNIISEAKHGSRGKVIKIRGRAQFHRRLIDNGIYCGRIVEIERVALPQDHIQVHVNRHVLLLSREEAAGICLESI
jgi:Fe2+ transport system protein FeoA